MKNITVGILAHVDAGKTTLAEALLYTAGKIRKPGRVDHGDTVMDTHELERSRGITIFSSQAQLEAGDYEITLLDTPGHVDFSSEMERTLRVLDYAVLVVSGIDGVQSHTRTLWRLLELYRVPTLIFVTKMDFARREKGDIIAELRRELSPDCADFTDEGRFEQLAMCSDELLDIYMSTSRIPDEKAAEQISARRIFPCFFGSGLKLEGVEDFLNALPALILPPVRGKDFGARVFKISRDAQGNRLVHMKLTGGTLRTRDSVSSSGGAEKVTQIRIYSGSRFTSVESVSAGAVCAVTGLSAVKNGQGLGCEEGGEAAYLEPVMSYRVILPRGTDLQTMLQRLRQLEEEDPMLRVSFLSQLQEIHVSLMGEVQLEILRSIIEERFGVSVSFGSGRVLYKETIENTVEGVGHYEPLRHYAEVHLIMEPLPRGSGLKFTTTCSEDSLDRNWQRLIFTHLAEKAHRGVLTGSPITDVKITLAAGRAHIKHTEGGDFRQATYRAVRNGLMQAKSKLLEPWYRFRIDLPAEQLGRAISDLRLRHGEPEPAEISGETATLRGRAPVSGINGYAAELASYTGGRGRLSLEQDGYGDCVSPEKVISEYAYDPEGDLENTPDSVFCAHGGGFTVKWDKVKDYMHLESCLRKEPEATPRVNRANLRIDEKELEAIMLREFGPIKRPLYRMPGASFVEKEESKIEISPRKKWFVIDGYNLIFALDELSALAAEELAAARDALVHELGNFAAFTGCSVVVVFDAYKQPGNPGQRFSQGNVRVVYTREGETGDMYIEKLVGEIGKNDLVRVVSSDSLIQLSSFRSGVLRMSSKEFETELNRVSAEIERILTSQKREKTTMADALSEALQKSDDNKTQKPPEA